MKPHLRWAAWNGAGAGRHNASLPWAMHVPVLPGSSSSHPLRSHPPTKVASPASTLLERAAGRGTCYSSGAQAHSHLPTVGLLCISPFWVPQEVQHLLLKAENKKIKQSLSLWVGYLGLRGHILISATPGCSKECQSVKHPCNTQRSLPGTDQDSSVTPPVPLSWSQAPGAFSCSREAGQTTRLQPCPVQIPVLRGPHPVPCAPHSLGDGSSPPRFTPSTHSLCPDPAGGSGRS